MRYHPLVLVDTGLLVAFYNRTDQYHSQVYAFFEGCTSHLITTLSCVTETMQLLPLNWKLQNDFLLAVAKGVFECEHLQPEDFSRIAELNFRACRPTRRFCRLIPDRDFGASGYRRDRYLG